MKCHRKSFIPEEAYNKLFLYSRVYEDSHLARAKDVSLLNCSQAEGVRSYNPLNKKCIQSRKKMSTNL